MKTVRKESTKLQALGFRRAYFRLFKKLMSESRLKTDLKGKG